MIDHERPSERESHVVGVAPLTSRWAGQLRRPGVWLVVAVVAVAFNLRSGIAAVAPVLPDIRADLGMSSSEAGLLTALPVICFAVLSPAAAWLGRRLGLNAAMLVGCAALATASVTRVLGGSVVLLAGTVVVGAAMTVGNVLLPAVIKRDFPHRVGLVTAMFTASLIAGAAAAAALTAPVSQRAGWPVGVAGWAAPAALAFVVWWLVMRRQSPASPSDAPGRSGRTDEVPVRTLALMRSSVAWAVAIFLGSQGAAYYILTAWLPTLLVDEVGVDVETGGLAMAGFQVLGIGGTVLIAALVGRRPQQGWLAVGVAGGWLVMAAGLAVWPVLWPVWTIAGGVAQGAGIALALSVIVLRSRDAATARGLSAMAQLVGYTMAAAGPVTVGALHEATGAWLAPLVVVIGLTGCMVVSGLVSGRDVTIST